MLNEVETAWALFQHRCALAVLFEITYNEASVEEMAESLLERPSWLKRKLYGQVPADLGDVLGWALLYGIQILPEFESIEQLKRSGKA